jgi:hypothetical protein
VSLGQTHIVGSSSVLCILMVSQVHNPAALLASLMTSFGSLESTFSPCLAQEEAQARVAAARVLEGGDFVGPWSPTCV